MAATSATVFQDNYSFADPVMAQHSFASKYDLDNPNAAASAYARYMVEHTRQQLQSIDPNAAATTSSSSRRTSQATSMSTQQSSYKPAALSPESSMGSATSPEA